MCVCMYVCIYIYVYIYIYMCICNKLYDARSLSQVILAGIIFAGRFGRAGMSDAWVSPEYLRSSGSKIHVYR